MSKYHFPSALILICLFIQLNAIAQNSTNTQMPKQQFLGNVMELRTEEWLAPSGSKAKLDDTMIVIDVHFLADNYLTQKFDSSGKLVTQQKSFVVNRRSNKTLDSTWNFYWINKQLQAQSLYVQNDRVDSVFNKYKKRSGLLENSLSYNKQGNLSSKTVYTYTGNRLFTKRIFNSKLSLMSFTRYKYSDKVLTEIQEHDGNMLLQEVKRSSKQTDQINPLLTNYSTAIMDGKGQLKKGITEVKDKLGNILEKSVINGDRVVEQYTNFTLDKTGNVLTEKTVNGMTEVEYAYTYNYDEKGNWIQKNIFKDGFLYAVILRTLQYYN